jgi:tight adherence protein B
MRGHRAVPLVVLLAVTLMWLVAASGSADADAIGHSASGQTTAWAAAGPSSVRASTPASGTLARSWSVQRSAVSRPSADETELKRAETSAGPPYGAMVAGVGAIGLGAMLLVMALLGGMGKPEMSLEKRIAAYTGKAPVLATPKPAPQGVTAQAVDIAAKALASNRGFEIRLGARLEAAGMSLKAAEWLLLHVGIAFASAASVFLLSGGDVLLAVLAFVAGAVLPWVYLGIKRSRRLKAFNAQLPATLQLMAGSLQAGLSLAQGMDTIVREGADPVAGEFRRALVETSRSRKPWTPSRSGCRATTSDGP